jgi:hypothetical protein
LKDKHAALLFDPIPFQNWPFNGFKSPLRHAFVAWTLQHTPEELLTVDKTLTGQGHLVKHMLIPGYSFDASKERQEALDFETWIER